MTKALLGIIGGSGIYDLPGLEDAREEAVASPWGEPSAALRRGRIGLPIVFLTRHDKGHRLSPSDINYRANIDVLKRAGVTDLISLSACGSFREDLPPGTFVAGRPVCRSHLSARELVLRQGLRRACLDGASGLAASAHSSGGRRRSRKHSVRARRHLCVHRGPAILHARRNPDLQGARLFGDRHDQHAGSQAGARGGDLLRERRHGDRFRLLAPRSRRGHGQRHHCGAECQRRQGGHLVARLWRIFRPSISPARSARTARWMLR